MKSKPWLPLGLVAVLTLAPEAHGSSCVNIHYECLCFGNGGGMIDGRVIDSDPAGFTTVQVDEITLPTGIPDSPAAVGEQISILPQQLSNAKIGDRVLVPIWRSESGAQLGYGNGFVVDASGQATACGDHTFSMQRAKEFIFYSAVACTDEVDKIYGKPPSCGDGASCAVPTQHGGAASAPFWVALALVGGMARLRRGRR